MSADLLPEDLLADVLARLSPRGLATSRCVCKPWRAAVDARGLLRADLLPLSFRGIVLDIDMADCPALFSRPWTTGPAICDNLDAFIRDTRRIGTETVDHCGGLLLLHDAVLNLATGQWAPLPRPPPPPLPEDFMYEESLVFDPSESPYYEVFSIPKVCWRKAFMASEWPPSPFVVSVFSSRTGRWEERTFAREGGEHDEPVKKTIAANIKETDDSYSHQHCSTFCRGRLHVMCHKGFVIRINTSGGTYQLMKPPMGSEAIRFPQFYLGKSKSKVYFVSVDYEHCRLQVWCLNESSHGQPEWVLRCDENLKPRLPPRWSYRGRGNGPWVLRYLNTDDDRVLYGDEEDDQGQLEWSSDIEDDVESEDGAAGCNGDDKDIDDWTRILERSNRHIAFLGLHPFKEIVFLRQSFGRVIAYHLNCSKIQDMGTLELINSVHRIDMPFPYTPCWIGLFPENN